ncbi:MAG: serine hydrolase [Chloroflexi bacterium HGW-Chloroflexi-10]|nr:MAG: serine hydrolase [Chloroflexi bacterium HGW-Chloroflexi-10]
MKFKKTLWILTIAIIGVVALFLVMAMLIYSPEYVYRVLVWQESDAFDWQKFPAHELNAAPSTYLFDVAPDPRVETLFAQLSATDNWNSFLETHETQAFIVIQDGKVLYENYFNNTQRDSIVTSFSVAKSYNSALIGMAIQEGYIKSVNDPITTYLPELTERDPRFKDITIQHLLLMASGLEYKEFRPLLFNSDDILTTYYPNQRKIALENTHIIDPPRKYFNYNKYHPQLLGMIIERATGMPVSNYLQTTIWDTLGMEFDGSWSIDSQESNFEKMETGVNARAIDFAKFGVLYLNEGRWQGKQIISKTWINESTRPLIPDNYTDYYSDWIELLPGQAYYNYMWWGIAREDGTFDFTALGDKGQFIYVSPHKNLVIVRNGIDFGIAAEQWLELFYEFANQF